MYCPNCGKSIPDGADHCPECGASLNSNSGKEVSSGVQTQPESRPSAPKSKVTAGLLGILLGWTGAHKFYLGYTKEGVIMLIVGVVGGLLFGVGTAIMAIIGLIEGIMYLTKSDVDFQNIYVQNHKGWF